MHTLLVLLLLLMKYVKSLELSDFTVNDGVGEPYSFAKLKHVPAVLIVNVASHCGYTDRNYRELQALRTEHDEDELAIVAFPCNQFGAQEPGSWEEIASFADRQYQVSFPIMAKVNVNGLKSSPLFAWLKAASGSPGDIPWNFSKFLVICGTVVKRYSHEVSPWQIERDIVNARATCAGITGELEEL